MVDMDGRHILYIEDNDDNIFMLTMRLERLGYKISIARDGEEGIAKANELKPDLIIMDLGLPVVDGWEATRRIKAAEETARIPIIALTAHAMIGEEDKARSAGCDDYDSKPVVFKRLVGKIKAQLEAGDMMENHLD